jgi:DnaK suppressor protein
MDHPDIYMETHKMVTMDFTPHLERLLALRARLRGDMNQMATNALMEAKSTSIPTDMAELGSENFDQELTLSLLGGEGNALDQIEAAIERIEEGTYGRCKTCGGRIPKTRLEAIPYAAQCVRCASEEEGVLVQPRQHRVLPR